MNRTHFINHIKNHYPDDYSAYSHGVHFNIDLSTIDNNGMLCMLSVNSKFEDIFSSMGLPSFNIPKQLVKLEFDYDYAEENPDDDVCRYFAYINLNSLYDTVVSEKKMYGESRSIYRIEDAADKGLYSGVGFKIMCDSKTGIQPNPADDESFMSIFNQSDNYISESYKKSWQFAFNDLNQLKNWVGDKHALESLIQHNYHIKEIIVSENCLIIGNEQVVYQPSGVQGHKQLPLSIATKLFDNEPVKLQTKKKPSI